MIKKGLASESMRRIGMAIRLEREARQWTLTRLADELNALPPLEPRSRQVSHATVTRWEQGATMPTFLRGLKLMVLFPDLSFGRLCRIAGLDRDEPPDGEESSKRSAV